MSNPLRDTILKDIVEPAIRASKKTLLGEVIDVDDVSGTIDIKPIGSPMISSYDSELVSEDSIQKVNFVNSSSFKDAKPEIGDRVYIDFINNDISKPVLLNIIKPVDSNTFATGLSTLPSESGQEGIASQSQGAINLGGGGIRRGKLTE